MITLLTSRYRTLQPTVTTYAVISGVVAGGTNEFQRQQIIPTGGTLGNCRFKLTAAPGAGKSWLVGLRVNGSTVLSTTISDAAVDGTILSTTAVSAGDVVDWITTPTSSPAATSMAACLEFEGTDSTESIILGCGGSTTFSTTVNMFWSPGGHGTGNTTDANRRQVMPAAGDIKKLYWQLSVDPGTSPDAYIMALHLNGADSALTSTITADNTTGNDTSNSVAVVAGDAISMKVAPSNTPSATPTAVWGMVFVPTTAGQAVILGHTNNNLDVSTTEYGSLAGVFEATTTTEADFQTLLPPSSLKNFYIELSGAPGSGGDAYGFTVRDDGADTLIVANVVDAATTANDTANTHTISADSLVNFKVVPAVTPTARFGRWGIVVIAPSGSAIKTIEGLAKASVKTINGLAIASVKTVQGLA